MWFLIRPHRSTATLFIQLECRSRAAVEDQRWSFHVGGTLSWGVRFIRVGDFEPAERHPHERINNEGTNHFTHITGNCYRLRR